MKRDIILIMEGGTIQGVFSSGVMTAFQKHNIRPRIHSIYAVSSGAHNAAYFLSGNSEVGQEIYYDYLLRRHSFLKHLSAKVIIKKILGLFFLGKSFDVIDLEYIRDLEINIIPLNLERIKNTPIKFYVRVFDPKTRKNLFVDAREHTIERLLQSSKVPPYAYTKHDTGYIDGGVMPCRDFLTKVVKKNTDKTIIYIFNDKKTIKKVTKQILPDLIDVIFKTRFLGLRYGLKHLFNIYSYTYVSSLKDQKHTHVLYDETGNSKREKNKAKIYSAYKLGYAKGEAMLKELNIIK